MAIRAVVDSKAVVEEAAWPWKRVGFHVGESHMEKPFRLAVKAVIFDEQGRCLLVRRSRQCKNFVGKWEWPGGKADLGDDFATALAHEVREETSLEIVITGLAGATQFEMQAAQVILLCLETQLVTGELHLNGEHDDFAWVPLGDIARHEYPPRIADLMQGYAAKKGPAS